MDKYGIITDIQRFSQHDGPGIRTSVFFKGCNLSCAWCHNPETIAFEPEIMIDPDKCINCGGCDDGCFSGARRTVGKRYSVSELMTEVLLDKDYYGSDGGVTLTGGEPGCQPDFAAAVLLACKNAGIGRVIETNLCYDESTLKRLVSLCDIVYCDLKIFDEATHISGTCGTNRQVKRNLELLDEYGIPFAVRTTVVSSINDTKEEIGSIASFVSGFSNLLFYELLSYSALGLSKNLEGKEARTKFPSVSKEKMIELIDLVRKRSIPVRLDGIEV